MTVNTFVAASKLQNLEHHLKNFWNADQKSHPLNRDDFIEWKKDVITILKIAHPNNDFFLTDFENTCKNVDERGVKIEKLLGILRRSRLALELETNSETNHTLSEAVKYSLSELYLKSWIFRGSAALLILSAGLFFGGYLQIRGYQIDIEKEYNAARNDIIVQGKSIISSMTERRDTVMVKIADLENNARNLENILKAERENIEKEMGETRGELILRWENIEIQMQDKIRSLDVILREQKQKISQTSSEIIDLRIPSHLEMELGRVTEMVTNKIDVSIPSRITTEVARLKQAVDKAIKEEIPLVLDTNSERIEQASAKIISDELPIIFETSVNKLGEASAKLIMGELSKQLELEKRSISEAASKLISGSLTARLELEKERISAESDQFRRGLWTHLEAKLDKLFSREIAEENDRISILSKEIEILKSKVGELQRN